MLPKETTIYPVLCYKFGDIEGKKKSTSTDSNYNIYEYYIK